MPALAAEAAEVASLLQLDSAVRMAVSLVPVQLDLTEVRLVRSMALLTWAARAPSTVMVSFSES